MTPHDPLAFPETYLALMRAVAAYVAGDSDGFEAILDGIPTTRLRLMVGMAVGIVAAETDYRAADLGIAPTDAIGRMVALAERSLAVAQGNAR